MQIGESVTISIKSEAMEMVIDAAYGASVRSLRWQGRDLLRPTPDDAEDPLNFAHFPLVPFSNRLAEPFPGQTAPLPRYMADVVHAIHGFGWQSPWEVRELAPTHLVLGFEGSGHPWPQPFNAEQRFEVTADAARFSITLTNLGDRSMPGGVGLHPYFPRDDALVTIGDVLIWTKGDDDLPAATACDHALARQQTPMSHVRLDHSFANWAGTARLDWPGRNLRVMLEASETLRNLVIYSPAENFFCIEPVSHLTNAANGRSAESRDGWRWLEPGQSLTGTMILRPGELNP